MKGKMKKLNIIPVGLGKAVAMRIGHPLDEVHIRKAGTDRHGLDKYNVYVKRRGRR